jgi:hypothetical protein
MSFTADVYKRILAKNERNSRPFDLDENIGAELKFPQM